MPTIWLTVRAFPYSRIGRHIVLAQGHKLTCESLDNLLRALRHELRAAEAELASSVDSHAISSDQSFGPDVEHKPARDSAEV